MLIEHVTVSRLATKITTPLRKTFGLQTPTELVAEAINRGINPVKLREVIDDLEQMVLETSQH